MRRIIGYDANALYLSTMLRDMPGGKGEVKKYTGQEGLDRVKDNKLFGFAEVDIEIPQKLWMKFEEMPPFFFTRQIPEQAVPQHMKDYMERTGRKKRRWKKAGWSPVSKKASSVCAPFAVVRESRSSDHSGVPYYRLQTKKSAEVVR